MTDANLADAEALRLVSVRYASGVDRGDVHAFLNAFHGEATLSFEDVERDDKSYELRGRDELTQVIRVIARRYARTFHFLGQASYEISDLKATGEVYCIAHHRRHNGDTYVMYIRYVDQYRREPSDGWRIASRRVVLDWTETRIQQSEVTSE